MRWLLALFLIPRVFEPALPGYRYDFPKDHFSHSNYRTEWWYYTGNLHTPQGRNFGFELTFFRQASPEGGAGRLSPTWQVNDIYLAHLALSDLDGKRFISHERLNRSGPGLAGADAESQRIWNGNWQIRWNGEKQSLDAVCAEFSLSLALSPEKALVIHGHDGISQKSAGAGHASHYISFPRLGAQGSINLQGQQFAVSGLAWMDHEFFSGQLDASQAGWDWMSVQLDSGDDLMIYRLRRKDGSGDSFSSGTFIPRSGAPVLLKAGDFEMAPGETWESPKSKARYPVQWRLRVPSLSLDLQVKSLLNEQELTGEPSYWEGAVRFDGRRANAPVHGRGYLEMTGYGRPLTFGR